MLPGLMSLQACETHAESRTCKASPVNDMGVVSYRYAYGSLRQRVQRLTQRHALHAFLQRDGHVFHDETNGLSGGVGDDGHDAHDVGVRQQLQRLELAAQHTAHVLVKPLGCGGFALVLDLEHAA
jgi:hypothetical protein